MARSASASGIAFGAPAGVNPLQPTFCPLWIKEAASAAVSTGNVIDSLFAIRHRRAPHDRPPEFRAPGGRASCPRHEPLPAAAAAALPPHGSGGTAPPD